MRFLRNLFLFIVLVYGLAYGYLWYETYSTLQRVSEGASPFAKVSYGSFFVSPLANEITVDDIAVVPQMAPDEFRVDQVRFYTDMPGFLILSGFEMKQGALPETIKVSLTNLQFNLAGKLFTMLEEMSSMQQPQQAPTPFANIDALGCGDIEQFQLVDYRLMGMKRINVDLNLRMNFDKIGEMFGVEIDANARGISSANMSTTFKVSSGKMGNVAQTKTIPPMRVTINDTGYYKMRNTYCASANNSTIEEYADRHIQLLASELGAELPEKISNAYRNYVLKGGRVVISIKPGDNVSPDELAYYKPAEVVDLLGLKISIGNTRVNLGELLGGSDASPVLAESREKKQPVAKQSAKKAPAPVKSSPIKQAAAAKPTAAQKAKKAPITSKPGYRPKNVDDAEKYIDKMVEVTLPGNKVRRGVLEKVRNNRLYLIMELHGGNLTYPVRINEIKKFRVMQ